MSKKDSQQAQINPTGSILDAQIRDLITSLALNVNSESDSERDNMPFTVFGNQDDGYLSLNKQEAIKYHQVLLSMIDTYCFTPKRNGKLRGKKDVSQKFIEQILDLAILKAIDINKQRHDIPLDQRVNQAIEFFKKELRQTPKEFECYYPVFGLRSRDLPFKIGCVELINFQEETLDEIGLKKKEVNSIAQNISIESFIVDFKIAARFGTTYAKVRVSAIDSASAEELAIRELRSTLEILNFFASFIPYVHNCHIYLSGEAGSEAELYAVRQVNDKPSSSNELATVGVTREGPIADIAIGMILNAAENSNLGFEKVCQLLSRETNSFQTLLINSIRWAGKAWVSNAMKRTDQAFLFYMIALESIILTNKYRDELRYRLSIRVAYFLGNDRENRHELFKRVLELYDLRSVVVHNGHIGVLDSDLNTLKNIVNECLIRLLRDEPFIGMKTEDDLDKWFDQQVFG